MAYLKIPSLNKKTDKYLFKNKFTSRRKTKRKLIIESFYMLIISLLLAYIIYLIPYLYCYDKLYGHILHSKCLEET